MIALVATAAHSGVPHPRTGPELSDVALFMVAVAAVALVRHALRRRFAKRRAPTED